jgi:Tol biopolymer transport system component
MQEPLTTHTWTWVRWVEWLSDETGILITARQGILDPDQVWHISRPAGEVRKLTNDLKAFYSISLSADSRSLLAIQTELRSEILYAPVSDGSRARQITFGVGAYAEVCHGTDDRILYSSQAGGNWDLWSMNTDGSDQRQLTVDAGYNSDVTVSPDGRYIYFSSSRQGALNVWRSNIDGSNAVRVTTGDGERWPRCSPDGKWLLFNSVGPSDDLYAIWKMPVEGGEPVLLAEGWSARPAISPDGRLVASFKLVDGTNRYQLTISPFEGGAPYRVIDLPNDFVVMPYVQWLPDGRSLSYAVTRKGSSNIWIQPLDKGEPKQLTEFTTGGNLLFDWSRDGKHLVIARRNWAPDLVLLSGFL